jgi:hypothetical protein
MKQWHVIEGMPRLVHGAANHPSEGACVMQYVSLLKGTRWTDHPRCTNVSVADTAIVVNDYSMDGKREERLLPEVLRLMHAQGISRQLARKLGRMYNQFDKGQTDFVKGMPTYRKWKRARNGDAKMALMKQWRDELAEQYWLPLLKEMLDLIEEEKGVSGGHTTEDDLLRAEQLRLEAAGR